VREGQRGSRRRQAEVRREEQEVRGLQANTGSGRQEQVCTKRGGHRRYTGIQACKSRLPVKKAGMHAGKNKQRSRASLAETDRLEQTRKGIYAGRQKYTAG
jgi:hypothetical protein